MDEDTTTVQPVAPAGADEATPVVADDVQPADAPVVAEPGEPEAGAEAEQPNAEPEITDKLKKYAESNGLELDSPSAIKAAQLALKNQSKLSSDHRKNSELEKAATAISDEDAAATATATGQDVDLIQRLQRVEVKESVREFWSQDGIDRAYEPTMIEILKDKPYLAGDLESLYATAVMKSGGMAAVKSQGGREALQSLAQKQQAAVPTGNATTTATPKEKPFNELSIPEMEAKLGFARR